MSRSGLWAQIGYAPEVTYGTYVAPTRFLEFNEESLKLDAQRIESGALRTANRVTRSDRWIANRKGAAGSVSHEVHSKGFGLLFRHCLGSSAITTPATGVNTRDHTNTLGDDANLSLTCQVGRPDTAGTSRPFNYLGCKVTEFELSNSVDELLMLSMELDANDEETTSALGVASYPASDELLAFTGATITIGGSQYDVEDIAIKVSKGLNTERYFLRNNSLKKQPFAAEMAEITVEMTGEFESLTRYAAYQTGAMAQIVATWEGSVIEAALRNSVICTLPLCRLDGETPTVGGPDILKQPLQFKALWDGATSPITIVYRTTDVAS